ncbi:MAG TPA: RecX family transcriptional regulator [Vicinamibacterales bacterium]|nr:RecX family transcriptional regulator [Vicinamibacterales bacterium]
MAADPYTYALTLLARRELSAAQIRSRLKKREYADADIAAAVARLQAARALDDGRVARTYARTAASVKGRGRARVLREIEALGIDRSTARDAIAEIFAELDEDALLTKALDRKLRGRRIQSAAEFRRLHQFLMRQGFEPGKIVRALEARGGRAFDET